MNRDAKPITILLADDDPDDRMLAREAFDESRLRNTLEMVEDGEDLMDYLHNRGKYSGAAARPKPSLILPTSICRARTGAKRSRKSKARPICGGFRLSF